jgi:eukaryotic-like serine/threonine-protein kinase
LIGAVINNYQVVSILGEGGMGAVYLAEHPFMGRKAAIKVLRKDLAEDPTLVERFMNEARAANAIRHPNIIDIIDVGLLPSGIPYLMMEFLDGESLAKRIERERPMPVAEAVDVAVQTAAALAAAHEKGIVHRDLKPDNLFLIPERGRPFGRVKVLDFGIAKLRGELSGSGAKTQSGAIMGTPPYMSPEQCRGISDEIDHRTDVYALGIILYEMLTGTPPFVSQGWGEVVHMHISKPPPPLRARNPDIPPELEAVILKALAKEPDARWGSMGEIEAALRKITPSKGQAARSKRSDPVARNAVSGTAILTPTTLRSSTGQVATEPGDDLADEAALVGRVWWKRPAALAVGGAAVAAIAVAIVVGGSSGTHDRGGTSDVIAQPAATAPVRQMAVPPPSEVAHPPPSAEVARPLVKADSPPIAPAPAVPEASMGKEVEAASPRRKKSSAAKPSHHAGVAGTPPASSPAPALSKKSNCTPNFYLDAQGQKHFKPECF